MRLEAGRQFVKKRTLTDLGERRLAWMDEKDANIHFLIYVDNVPQDLPGDDKPETVQKLYDETNKWMFEEE